MNIFLISLNLILVLLAAFFLLSQLGLRDKTPYLIAAFTLSYANIVLLLQVAGLFSILAAGPVLALQCLVTCCSFLVWSFNKKPPLLGPFTDLDLKNWFSKDAIFESLRSPWLYVLAFVVCFVYIKHIQVILSLPPINYDSLTYHLSRVGYWLQYQSFYPWPTLNPRQTTFPFNAELGLLWTMLWWGSDQLAGFVQWLTIPVIMLGIYGMVRLLGYLRHQAVLAALLWATLPQVLYQSITTQNDLVTTSFWVGLVYFFFYGFDRGSSASLALSGICLGLAIGTKSTSLLMLPALGAVLIIFFWLCRKDLHARRMMLQWGGFALLGVLVFGSYIYVQNSIAFGHPLGPQSYVSGIIEMDSDNQLLTYKQLLVDNTARYLFQLIDFSPLPEPMSVVLNQGRTMFFSFLYGRLGIDVGNPMTIFRQSLSLDYVNPPGENNSWFGPLVIFLIPSIIVQGIRGWRDKDPLRIGLALFAVGFLVVHSAVQGWTPAKGRYYMIAVTLAFPLLAGFLASPARWRTLWNLIPVLIGLTVLLTISTATTSRTIGWSQIFAGDRRASGLVNNLTYRFVMENVPETASIGIVGYDDLRDYPLFGEHFTRHLTWAVPAGSALLPQTDVDRFAKDLKFSEYLFIAADTEVNEAPKSAPQNFALLLQNGQDSIWVREELQKIGECDHDKWPFNKLFKVEPGSICPQFPIAIGIPTRTTPRGDFSPELAEGLDLGFSFGLLVKDGAQVELQVRFSDLIDDPRNFQIQITDVGGWTQSISPSFQEGDMLVFDNHFERGRFQVNIVVEDGSMNIKILQIQIRVDGK